MASMVDSFKTGKVSKPTDLTRKIEVIGYVYDAGGQGYGRSRNAKQVLARLLRENPKSYISVGLRSTLNTLRMEIR